MHIEDKLKIVENSESIFDGIKHIDEDGIEYWYARELMEVLQYNKWQKFIMLINKAKVACDNSNYLSNDHFTQVGKMIKLGKGGKRKILDYRLSRYACYLIVQNADPRKEVVALGQTYFAIQTRKQELSEEYDRLSEDEKRVYQRNKVRSGNIKLNNNILHL
jgi:DNA-damage-inducible protein D